MVGPIAGQVSVPCREAYKLISEQLDGPLPLRRWVQLKLHLYMCDVCSRYGDQLILLRKLMNLYVEHAHDHDHEDSAKLSDEAKGRIKEKVAQGSEGESK